MAARGEDSIARRVFFQAVCHRCGWKGTEQDWKTGAAFELAGHRVDRHPAVPR